MQFFLPMTPPRITKQQQRVTVRNGKPIFFDGPELLQARAKLIAALASKAPSVPQDGPIRLVAKWIWDSPVRARHGQYKTTRPDCDNLTKLLQDCMTRCGFWHDDAQVASLIVEKFWGDPSGIFIEIMPLAKKEENG